MNDANTIYYIAIPFAALGGIAILVALIWMARTKSFIRNAFQTQGKVISLTHSTDHQHRTTYSPVVEFRTRHGETIIFREKSGSNPPSAKVGEIVKVLYQPHCPNQAKINQFFSLWGGAAIFLLLGFIFSGIGIGLILAKPYLK